MSMENIFAFVTEWSIVLVGGLAYWIWRAQTRIIKLEAWQDFHQQADGATHDSLERAVKEIGDKITQEIGLFRAESSEQHQALRTELSHRIDKAIEDGAEARRELHKGQAAVARDVNQLIGEHRAARRVSEGGATDGHN